MLTTSRPTQTESTRRFRELCDHQRITAEAAARVIGMDAVVMRDWYRGRAIPDGEVVRATAARFGVLEEWLLGELDAPKVSTPHNAFSYRIKTLLAEAGSESQRPDSPLGLARTTFKEWIQKKRGKTKIPRAETVSALAIQLGVTTDWLLGVPGAPRSRQQARLGLDLLRDLKEEIIVRGTRALNPPTSVRRALPLMIGIDAVEEELQRTARTTVESAIALYREQTMFGELESRLRGADDQALAAEVTAFANQRYRMATGDDGAAHFRGRLVTLARKATRAAERATVKRPVRG